LTDSLGLKVNWIWFYHDSSQMNYRDAAAFRQTLNRQSGTTGQRYLMLEDSLTVRGVMWAVWTYVCLWFTSLRLERLRDDFRFSGGALNFFEILKDEWYSSLRGDAAMSACLYAAAFRSTVDQLPATTVRMIYPWENQGWEHLLLCAWKKVSRAPALAMVHTPGCTSPMELRTFRGKESTGEPEDRCLPDKLVAFSRQSAATLREWGWPTQIVTEGEALRYMRFAAKYGVERRSLPKENRQLLLVSGMRGETDFQLRLLSAASEAGGLAAYSKVTIKPHPFCSVNDAVAALSFSRPVQIDHRPLDELFGECDVVFASNATSAGIEAAWAGLPLILAASIGLNLNPLKGVADVRFVATTEALVDQLNRPQRIPLAPDTFLLDRNLPRWRALLTQPLTSIN
jgi:surface carbohydrate biosynthesis protein (TIGR04326 family)